MSIALGTWNPFPEPRKELLSSRLLAKTPACRERFTVCPALGKILRRIIKRNKQSCIATSKGSNPKTNQYD